MKSTEISLTKKTIARVNGNLPEIIPDLCSARKMLYAPDVLFKKGYALDSEIFSFHVAHEPWTIFAGHKAQKYVFDLPASVADPFQFRAKIPAMHLPQIEAPVDLEAGFDLNRRLILKEFERRSPIGFTPTLIRAAAEMVERQMVDESGIIPDFPRFLLATCVQMASQSLLGKDLCKALGDEFIETYVDVDSGLSVMSIFMPWIPNSKRAISERAKKKLVAMFMPIISQRRESGLAVEDLLDGFLREHKDIKGPSALSDANILWLINVLHWGAHHYPAVHAFWAGVDILTRPEVLERVQSELSAIDELTPSSINSLSYLRACMKESVRLHALLAIPRRLLQDIDYDGQIIKKGSLVSVSPFLSHRDPQCYNEAESFLPDRWISSNTRVPPWSFIPGGGGNRGCVGMQLTLDMLTVIWATMLKNYKLEFINHPPQLVLQAMLLAPKRPVPIRYATLKS